MMLMIKEDAVIAIAKCCVAILSLTSLQGCSTGGLMQGEDCAIFKGVLSTRNNGGFSSIRSPQTDMDLSDSDGILINCKGDGRLYKLQVTCSHVAVPCV